MTPWRRTERTRPDPDAVLPIDQELVARFTPLVKALEFCFRFQVRGLERIPKGPALLVGNHNGGIVFLEPVFFGLRWHQRTGGRDPMYWLSHDAIVGMPGLGPLLVRAGAIRAQHGVAEQALTRGHKVVVFPGGNREAFRPFRERNRVDFADRTGFLKLALKARVPIVPVASIGGHETFFVLTRGEWLARLTGAKWLLRSDAFPIFLGMPWGIGVGPIFHLPLPSRLEVEVGDPIPLDEFSPDDAGDPAVLCLLRERVVGRIQTMVDGMAARRRLPVWG